MEQYIGDRKIMLVMELPEMKTPGGADMVEVSFENGTKEVMPKKRLETIAISSETPGEPLKDKQILKDTLGNTIIAVLMEYGIKDGEVLDVLNAAMDRKNKMVANVYKIKYGFTEDETPLIELNKIEVENFKKENGDQAS